MLRKASLKEEVLGHNFKKLVKFSQVREEGVKIIPGRKHGKTWHFKKQTKIAILFSFLAATRIHVSYLIWLPQNPVQGQGFRWGDPREHREGCGRESWGKGQPPQLLYQAFYHCGEMEISYTGIDAIPRPQLSNHRLRKSKYFSVH